MVQRKTLKYLRSGHMNRAARPAAHDNTAVLDTELKVIAVAPSIPSTDQSRDVFCHHTPANKGTRVAPKHPARIACANGPCARV